MRSQTAQSGESRLAGDHVPECAEEVIRLLDEGRQDSADSYVDSVALKSQQTSCKAFYHSLISACAKADGPRAALWCALKMIRVGFKANVVTFNSLFQSCVRSGDVSAAQSFWATMKDAGVSPNTISYHTMLHICAKAGDMELAETWLRTMHADLRASTHAANIVLAGLAKACACNKAREVFRWMQDCNVKQDHATFEAMVQACLLGGHLTEAEHWVLTAEAEGVWLSAQAYSDVVQAHVDQGLVQRAEQWRRKMEQFNLSPDEATRASLAAAWTVQSTSTSTPTQMHAAEAAAAPARTPGLHTSSAGSSGDPAPLLHRAGARDAPEASQDHTSSRYLVAPEAQVWTAIPRYSDCFDRLSL